MTVWLFPAPVEMTSELSKELTKEDLSKVTSLTTVENNTWCKGTVVCKNSSKSQRCHAANRSNGCSMQDTVKCSGTSPVRSRSFAYVGNL